MNSVRVTHEGGKFRHEIYAGQHHWSVDEPVTLGGEDSAPSPFDLLAGALGACTAITLRMYAQRKAWPLENAEVVVDLSRTTEATTLNRTIKLMGDLTEEQRIRLLEIANRCPVHRILEGKIVIETKLL